MKRLRGIVRADEGDLFLEIGESAVKIAESTSEKGARRIRLVKCALASQEDHAVSAAIREALEASAIRRYRVRINLPRHLVTVRFLKLPSVVDDEIRSIVKIEAVKHVPYADEGLIAGYRVIEKTADGYARVMLAIVRARIVNDTIAILKDAGLKTEAVYLGSEALLLWYRSVRAAADEGSVLVANISSDHFDIDIVKNNEIVFTRGARYDSSDVLTADKIRGEIKVSVATHEKESGDTVTKVVITGSPEKTAGCVETVAKDLKRPVEAITQTAALPASAGAPADAAPASFAELMGLALRYHEAKVSFLPEEIAEENRLTVLRKSLTISAIAGTLIIVALLTLTAKKFGDKVACIAAVNTEAKKIAPRVTTAKQMTREIAIVKEEVGFRPLAIDVVSEVYRLTPSNLSLTMLDYESQKSLVVRGGAATTGDIFKYVTTLEGSPYFEGVKVKYATKRVASGRETFDFEIGCALTKMK